MAGKKGDKGKKQGKKKGKPKKLAGTSETPEQLMKRFLMIYEDNCKCVLKMPGGLEKPSLVSPSLKAKLKDCIENNQIMVRFVLEAVERATSDDLQVSLEAFCLTLRKVHYKWIKDLHVWQIPLMQEDLATLALIIERGPDHYPIKSLELMDCLIEPYPLKRFSAAFDMCPTLSSINLDYNEFGNEGCRNLCQGLVGNKTVISLSLCYCNLTAEAGKILGDIAATTAVREFYLDGNDLGSEGTIELLRLLADQAETEAFEREEEKKRKLEEEALKEMEAKERRYNFDTPVPVTPVEERTDTKPEKKKGKKKKKKKTKEPPPPPTVGPWMHKLHIADNGIDAMGRGGHFAPLICMRLIKSLLINCMCLEELDLEDNLIGDMGGREIMDGLKDRDEARSPKMPAVKVRTTHRMNADTFSTLVKLGAGLKKKKKKGGKKKKK